MVRSYRDQVTRSANRDVCRLWMGWLGSELALVTAPTEALPLSMCVTHLMIMSYHRRTRPFSPSQSSSQDPSAIGRASGLCLLRMNIEALYCILRHCGPDCLVSLGPLFRLIRCLLVVLAVIYLSPHMMSGCRVDQGVDDYTDLLACTAHQALNL